MTGTHEDLALPRALAVFPLEGAVLFPRAVLPLNIFEPRYLAMIRDATAGDNLIGIIQPRGEDEPPLLYDVGGLGRITEYAETSDGRIVVAITGLTRFRVRRELPAPGPYRLIEPDFSVHADDLREAAELTSGTRGRLEQVLRSYLDRQGLAADWEAIGNADDEGLVNTLCAVCPFEAVERQALLEAATLAARVDVLTTLMRFARGGDETITLQ